MSIRGIALILGATAGGMLAAALMPTGVAAADPDVLVSPGQVVPVPPGPPGLPSLPGPPPPPHPPFPFGPPPPGGPPSELLVPINEPPAVGSTDIFGFAPVGNDDVFENGGSAPLFTDVEGYQQFVGEPGATLPGSFLGIDQTITTPFFSIDDVYVSKDLSGDAPPVGSLFEVTNFGHGFEYISEQLGHGADAQPQEAELVTPWGNIPVFSEQPEFFDPGGTLPPMPPI